MKNREFSWPNHTICGSKSGGFCKNWEGWQLCYYLQIFNITQQLIKIIAFHIINNNDWILVRPIKRKTKTHIISWQVFLFDLSRPISTVTFCCIATISISGKWKCLSKLKYAGIISHMSWQTGRHSVLIQNWVHWHTGSPTDSFKNTDVKLQKHTE